MERKITVMQEAKKMENWDKFIEMQKELGLELALYKSYDGVISKINSVYQKLVLEGEEEKAKHQDEQRRKYMKKIIQLK